MTEQDFINNDREESFDFEDEASKSRSRFPVKAQLFILGLFLASIFAGVIVPKTLALINSDASIPALVSAAPESDEILATSVELGEIALTAKAAVVYDTVTKEVLFEKNGDRVLPLASITKLMTALVAYELVPEETKVTVDGDAIRQESAGPLREGDKFKAKDLADFALITSYNGASYALAHGIGEALGEKDPVAQFVAAMNIKAEDLNLDTLSYKNPTGLDLSTTEAGAFGSAKDVSLLMAYILNNHPQILLPTVRKTTTITSTSGNVYEARNTNDALAELPNLLGSKTGYTDLANGNLTVVFDAGYNHPVVITVLGSTRDERFSDVLRLTEATLEAFSKSE